MVGLTTIAAALGLALGGKVGPEAQEAIAVVADNGAAVRNALEAESVALLEGVTATLVQGAWRSGDVLRGGAESVAATSLAGGVGWGAAWDSGPMGDTFVRERPHPAVEELHEDVEGGGSSLR